METQCYIGTFTNDECHKNVYGVVPKIILSIYDYNEEDKMLFSLRVCSDVSSVCKYHESKYLHKYHHLFGQSCSDPLSKHKKSITKGLREISLEHFFKEKNFPVALVPGKSLCPTCYLKIFVVPVNKRIKDYEEHSDDEFCEQSEILEKVDSACAILGVSPACKIRKVSAEKRSRALKSKLEKVSGAIRKNLELSFGKAIPIENPEETTQTSKSEYDQLIEKLKEKCAISNKEDKIKILSLLPSSWSRAKISTEFKISDRLVKLTRELVTKQGILPELGKKKASRIDDETIKKVKSFYEDDEYSRIMPGKKDCVSFKVKGVKFQEQKRLVLCNLNELYSEFKKKHPECKIGRSKFCELRPKWCVLAGASGTHNVCVCIYHQNVKLMIEGAKLEVDYKDLLEILVCSISSYNCMMGKCDQCPGIEALSDMFQESEEGDSVPDNITYKQWVTSDRTEMVTVIKPREEFFKLLAEKLESLKKHHFISKVQAKFLKERKENLTESECIVLADFSENYSFVVQDEAQGHHWVNQQATVHPFVYYYKDGEVLKSHSFCIISDHLEHNTSTVHSFQQHLIKYIKENQSTIEKLIYFSDGAASQYKNKKNFINMCYHKQDFGLYIEWHFFASSHGKNACDGVGGTTKREVMKASLQRTFTNQILTPEEMYSFCLQKIKGITYVYVKSDEISANHNRKLQDRYDKCQRLCGTRSFHCFIPESESTLKCYLTSSSSEYEKHQVVKAVPLTIRIKDTIACIYDGQWWLAEVNDISEENKDVHVMFYHPPGPRTSFQKNKKDQAWVPMKNVLRKLNALELSTVTGRSYTITPKLSEEISVLLNEH